MTRCRDEMGAVSLIAANCQVLEARIDFFFGPHTHTVDSTPVHSTEPGFDDGYDSIPFHSHDGGTGCVSGLVAHGGTESPSLLLETSHARPDGTMAPSWASTAHVGLAATAVRPTRHSDHLAEIHSPWSGALVAACRTYTVPPYELGPDRFAQHAEQCDHHQPMRAWTITECIRS